MIHFGENIHLVFSTTMQDKFSPYLDPEPWAEYFDDFARRYTTAIIFAFCVHVILLIIIQPNFVIPDLIDEPPEAINVEIVSFEPCLLYTSDAADE